MPGMIHTPQGWRIAPRLEASEMRTYSIVAPRSTHFRPASCSEVGCPHFHYGWITTVDENLELGQAQAHYIRKVSKRQYTETKDAKGLTSFRFEAGQECFTQHKVRLDKPELFVVRDGDWRGNPRGTPVRKHVRAEDWVEDFALHQGKVSDRVRKG